MAKAVAVGKKGIWNRIAEAIDKIIKGMQSGLAGIFGVGGNDHFSAMLDEVEEVAGDMNPEISPALAKTAALKNEFEKRMDASKVLDYLRSPGKDPALASQIKDESVRQWATRLAGKHPEMVAGATPEQVYQHITGQAFMKGVPTVAELKGFGPQVAFGRKVASEISQELKVNSPRQVRQPAEVISFNAARSTQVPKDALDSEIRFTLARVHAMRASAEMSRTAKAGGMGMSASYTMKPSYATG